ncbi:MAG TPA: hypothetical protein VJ785_03670 [Anaerolineales bacterium]|nr:hypothetical protein [Anaerolineales bacterium]
MGGCGAAQPTELAGTQPELLPERFAECRMGVETRGERDPCDVHRAHAQLAAGPLQAHAANVAGRALANASSEDAMEVGDGESRHRRQRFPIERLMEVLTDVAHHICDAVRIFVKSLGIRQHGCTIVYQNGCSLFQMYHFQICGLDTCSPVLHRAPDLLSKSGAGVALLDHSSY